jgi:hypothetical protein
MSKDKSGGNTKSTNQVKFELRRALPVYLEDTSIVVEGTQRRTGFAIIVQVNAALLAQSRRDGGIEHHVGVIELEDNTLGLVELVGQDAIHYIVFDPSERIMRDILVESERSGCFLRIFLVDEDDVRVTIMPDNDQMCEVIRNASRYARCDTQQFAEANLALAEQLRAAQAQSELAEECTPDVVLHSFLTDERFVEAERMAASDETKIH